MLQVAVLFTSIVSSKIADNDWHKLETLLRSKGVGFHGVDGSLPDRKAGREALWAVSGRSWAHVGRLEPLWGVMLVVLGRLWLKNGPGPTLLIRAEMDGLPV